MVHAGRIPFNAQFPLPRLIVSTFWHIIETRILKIGKLQTSILQLSNSSEMHTCFLSKCSVTGGKSMPEFDLTFTSPCICKYVDYLALLHSSVQLYTTVHDLCNSVISNFIDSFPLSKPVLRPLKKISVINIQNI